MHIFPKYKYYTKNSQRGAGHTNVLRKNTCICTALKAQSYCQEQSWWGMAQRIAVGPLSMVPGSGSRLGSGCSPWAGSQQHRQLPFCLSKSQEVSGGERR